MATKADTAIMDDSKVLFGCYKCGRMHAKYHRDILQDSVFCVWITKLENIDNETDYILDMRLLCQKNCYEIIKCNSLQIAEEDLLKYAAEYFNTQLGVPIGRLRDNIEQKEYLCDESFLKKYETKILNYNCFDYRPIQVADCTTWQEEGLLDLLKISIRNRQIVPMLSGKGRSVPDVSSWTRESLLSIKEFFKNEISDFLVETVLYVLLQTEPSQKVKLLHCKLLAQALEAGEDSFEITNSSSYQVLSYLHADHMMKDCNTSQEYITLIKLFQEEKELYNFIRRGLKEIKLENYRKTSPSDI